MKYNSDSQVETTNCQILWTNLCSGKKKNEAIKVFFTSDLNEDATAFLVPS